MGVLPPKPKVGRRVQATGFRAGGAFRQRGMSLIEIMVVIAILLALAVIVAPMFLSFLALEQQRVARELATDYGFLHDEAVLRNVTFRVAYHLDEGYYEIEVGRPDTLIFDNPEQLADYEEERQSRLRRMTEKERAQEGLSEGDDFAVLSEKFAQHRDLPQGTKFGGFYTPQYGKMVFADPDDDENTVVYSYIFANGFAEQTLVQIVDADNAESGWTISVESLSGRVQLFGEVRDLDDFDTRIPEQAPELP